MENRLLVRASEASNLMTLPRSKRGEELSETTKTWLKTKAKESFYGYTTFQGNKYTQKGIECEPKAIELLSELHYFNKDEYKKNTERKVKGGFSGECDIIYENEIIDIKCPWSLDTFPAFKEDANKAMKKSGYDWQQKVYCYLWEVETAHIAYVMMSTPGDLVKEWDDSDLHNVEHIEISKRVTMSDMIELTDEDVELMESQYQLANEYYNELLTEIENK